MTKWLRRIERGVKATSSRRLRSGLAWKRVLTRRAPCLFVTSFPKSGSTFLVSALSALTGYARQFLGQDFLNEHDLYLPRLVDAYDLPIVSHHHSRATPSNLALMREFSMRPVILVRAIDDCLVSLRDHLEHESRRTPTFTADESFLTLPYERQLDRLVDLATPWYLDFLAGWTAAAAGRKVECLWLGYEDLMGDPVGRIDEVLRFHRIERTPAEIAAVVEGLAANGKATRMNVGVSGRGRERLSPAQQERLDRLCRYYRGIDLHLARPRLAAGPGAGGSAADPIPLPGRT